MKIGIYNRWLTTLGGGERLSMAIAEHLARGHNVDFISHTPVQSQTVAARLDLDLRDINFRAIPVNQSDQPASLAAEYDLFINASNADFVPPTAKNNAMLVYFPVPPPAKLDQRMRRKIAKQIDRFGTQPRFITGVFGHVENEGTGSRGLLQIAQIALPAASVSPYRLQFSLAPADPSVTEAILDLGGEIVQKVSFTRQNHFVATTLTVPPGTERVLTIIANGDPRNTGAQLYMTPLRMSSRRARLYQHIFTETWPELGERQQNTLPTNIRSIVQGYDLLWAISKYTERWITAYWNLPSTLLYPPVAVERFPPRSKRPIILSVGRFFAGNHNKKHIVMVEAFQKLLEEGLCGWQLHLVGGVTPGQRHREYLDQVRQAAEGYPIHIHTDMPNNRLTELFGSSSIYWHAAGYGEDPTKHPGKFEHFGISVIEAMAAGCVPVVVGQGGLTELVRHERDGFLWYTLDKLRSNTSTLIKNNALRSRMAQAAIVSSRRFDKASFQAELDDSLAPLMCR